MRKFVTVSLSVVLGLASLSSLAGCKKGGEEIDATKTQLYVGFVNGGLGDVWINTIADRFEEAHAGDSFETGKTGVQIVLHGSKSDYYAPNLEGKVGSNGQDVMFVESFYQYEFKGDLLDLTETITTPLTEYGETKSIEDKMTSQYVTAHKDENGKYHALPWYEGYYGIMYDVDLFDREALYFAPDSDTFITDLSQEKGYGPDGLPDTYDDGLPATYEQYFLLCDELVARGMIPCIWSGLHSYETNKTIMGLHVDYEGLANASLNLTYNGTANNLITVDENGMITPRGDVQITKANGYELMNQAGRYYALKFAEQLVDNPDYYHWLSFSTANSHTGAQEEFLYSSYSSKKTPIAMILDGVWWENEADGVFTSMVDGGYGSTAARENRRFGFMPFPKATEKKVGEKLTIAEMPSGVIASGTLSGKKADLAKQFIRFCHTDESLKTFSKITSVMRPFDYTLEGTEFDELSYYGKSLYDIHKNADRMFLSSTTDLYAQNQEELLLFENYTTKINQLPYVVPFTTFKDEGISAEAYFLEGLKDWTAENWAGKYSIYFKN